MLSVREFSRYFSRYKHKDVLVVEDGRAVGQWLGAHKDTTKMIEQEIAYEVANNKTIVVGGAKWNVSDIMKEIDKVSDNTVGQEKSVGHLQKLADETAEKFKPKIDPVVAKRMGW